jgi:hypothetical protein
MSAITAAAPIYSFYPRSQRFNHFALRRCFSPLTFHAFNDKRHKRAVLHGPHAVAGSADEFREPAFHFLSDEPEVRRVFVDSAVSAHESITSAPLIIEADAVEAEDVLRAGVE